MTECVKTACSTIMLARYVEAKGFIFKLFLVFFFFLVAAFPQESPAEESRLKYWHALSYIKFVHERLLYRSIRYCVALPDECQLTEDEHEILKEIFSGLAEEIQNTELSIVHPRDNPSLFNTPDTSTHRLAVTYQEKAAPIFFNAELLDLRVDLEFYKILSILVHEYGHHRNIDNHETLEEIGSKVARVLEQRTEFVNFYEELDHPGIGDPELFLYSFGPERNIEQAIQSGAVDDYFQNPSSITEFGNLVLVVDRDYNTLGQDERFRRPYWRNLVLMNEEFPQTLLPHPYENTSNRHGELSKKKKYQALGIFYNGLSIENLEILSGYEGDRQIFVRGSSEVLYQKPQDQVHSDLKFTSGSAHSFAAYLPEHICGQFPYCIRPTGIDYNKDGNTILLSSDQSEEGAFFQSANDSPHPKLLRIKKDLEVRVVFNEKSLKEFPRFRWPKKKGSSILLEQSPLLKFEHNSSEQKLSLSYKIPRNVLKADFIQEKDFGVRLIPIEMDDANFSRWYIDEAFALIPKVRADQDYYYLEFNSQLPRQLKGKFKLSLELEDFSERQELLWDDSYTQVIDCNPTTENEFSFLTLMESTYESTGLEVNPSSSLFDFYFKSQSPLRYLEFDTVTYYESVEVSSNGHLRSYREGTPGKSDHKKPDIDSLQWRGISNPNSFNISLNHRSTLYPLADRITHRIPVDGHQSFSIQEGDVARLRTLIPEKYPVRSLVIGNEEKSLDLFNGKNRKFSEIVSIRAINEDGQVIELSLDEINRDSQYPHNSSFGQRNVTSNIVYSAKTVLRSKNSSVSPCELSLALPDDKRVVEELENRIGLFRLSTHATPGN